MDFTTFDGGRRAAVHYYRERVELIVRTLVREKKGSGSLLLKELILTYRKVPRQPEPPMWVVGIRQRPGVSSAVGQVER